jgi:hypothetical protein
VKHVRNVAIVLALGAVVWLAPGAGLAAGLLAWALGVIFLGVLAWFAAVMYRQYKGELFSIGDTMRGVLYGSVAVAVLTVTATGRLWQTPVGVVAWFVLVAGASFGVYAAWRSYGRY